MDAVIAVEQPKGVRLLPHAAGLTLTIGQNGWVRGLILFVIAGFVGFFQWRTWHVVLKESAMFHQMLWGAIVFCLILGTIFTFMRFRIRFKADGFEFSQPILRLGRKQFVSWDEIQGIGSGAVVTMQGGLLIPDSEIATDAFPSVASVIKVKTARGTLAMGDQLKSEHRSYLARALAAYTRTWRAAVSGKR